MKIFGSLSIFVSLAVLTVFTPIAHSATISEKEISREPPKEDLYQVYAELFFMKRELNQAMEMSVREGFLNWLYYGIVLEVRKRKSSDPDLTLDALNPIELEGYSEETYQLPENIDDLPLQESYLAHEKFERDEYNHKYLKARLIKEKLITTASPKQRLRMFNKDLSSTITTYTEGHYTEAVLKFDELIKEYGFDDLDDIFFYRGESYFALNLSNIAIRDFERVISSPNVDPKYHKTALNRLISLYGNLGNLEKLKEHWENFQESYSATQDNEYWQVVELVARYLMIVGDLTGSKALFDQIPQSNGLFPSSQLLAAQSSLMQLDLDDAERRFNLLISYNNGNVPVSPEITNEAILKLGYVNFLRGDYNDAYSYFSEVNGDESLREIALISSAWSLYRINAYDKVINTCTDFVSQFPNSEYQYEAIALMGHCQEVIGQDTIAVNLFEEIMSAVDDRQDYRDFVYEKRQIANLSSDLNLIESEVFGKNRRESFDKYLSVRKKLTTLKQKIRLAEGYKSNPDLEDMVVEQALLANVINGQNELEETLLTIQDRIKISDYEEILTNLSDLSHQVSGGIEYQLSQLNLTQREEKQRHEAMLSDSLVQSTNREIQSIDKSLEKVNDIKNSIADANSPELMIELTAINVDLQNMRKKLLHAQTNLSGYGEVEMTSSLDEWSDFAYLRFTYGGLNFDNFSAQQNRLVELDKYIQQLSQILADRNRVDEDSTKLSPNLLLASGPGEEPYRAPPIPLWGDNVGVFSDDKASLESDTVSDTSAAEEKSVPSDLTESHETEDGSGSSDEISEDSEITESEESEEVSTSEDEVIPEAESSSVDETGEEGTEEDEATGEDGIQPSEEEVPALDNGGEAIEAEAVDDETDSPLEPAEPETGDDSEQDESIEDLETVPDEEVGESEEELLDEEEESTDPVGTEDDTESSEDKIDSEMNELTPDEDSELDEKIETLPDEESIDPDSDEQSEAATQKEEGDQQLQDESIDSSDGESVDDARETIDPMDVDDETDSSTAPPIDSDSKESPQSGDPIDDPEAETQPETGEDPKTEEAPVDIPDSPGTGEEDPKVEEEQENDSPEQAEDGNQSDELTPVKEESEEQEENDVPPAEPDEDPNQKDPTQP